MIRTLNIILLILFFSCKKDIPPQQNRSKSVSNDSCAINYSIQHSDTNEKEFISAGDNIKRFEPLTDKDKSDTIISLKTNGKQIDFKDIIPGIGNSYYDEHMVTYRNLGYNEKLDKHLIHVNYYEGDEYLLIDNLTSEIDTLNGYPQYSGNGKNLLSFYSNPYAERQINGKFVSVGDIELHSACNRQLRRIHTKSYDYIPVAVRWKNNTTVLIKAIPSVSYDTYSNDPDAVTPDAFIYKKIILDKKK